MTKESRQKFKYLDNKKSFWDEIKSIFHNFWRAIKTNKKNVERWEPNFKFTYLPSERNLEKQKKQWSSRKKTNKSNWKQVLDTDQKSILSLLSHDFLTEEAMSE